MLGSVVVVTNANGGVTNSYTYSAYGAIGCGVGLGAVAAGDALEP
jgi:hypothetical protein